MSLPFLTDFRRAEIAFRLLFAFLRDEAWSEPDFDGATAELLRGARLPEATRARLRVVYDRVLEEPDQFESHAAMVAAEFSEQRDVLYALLSIMLRLTTDDGMLCRRDSERIRFALQTFSLTTQEFERFSLAERSLIEYFLYGKRAQTEHLRKFDPDDLYGHYSVLGCRPESSDADVRAAYRKLVMKFHPDRARPLNVSDETAAQARKQFEAVQSAYEQIKKVRKLTQA